MVGIMCGVAVVLAMITFDPNSSENFFLKIANQTSYIKPGLVIVFFWGILWHKTNPYAAVIVLLGSPLIGFACDYIYGHLANYDIIKDNFGEKFNFLYRVFAIFIIGSILIYGLSINLNGDKIISNENELTIPLKGVLDTVLPFILLHLPLILMVYSGFISHRHMAIIASILTLVIFFWYKNKHDKKTPFLHSDIFYAGLLTAAMVFIMYFFA
jgi:SSS family solute:Na+ symporter